MIIPKRPKNQLISLACWLFADHLQNGFSIQKGNPEYFDTLPEERKTEIKELKELYKEYLNKNE